MAIDPTTTTTIKVGDLQSAAYSTTDLIPHEVGGYLKKGNLQDLATFIGEIIDVTGGVGFRAVEVNDGETLPATTEQEFILVGPGTFPNVGGGATITTTEPLNALVSNGTYWFIGVEIPITASGVWGTISGVLSDQTDLNNVLVAKADLIDGKVPNTQLPSYVDDVIEVANFAALPATGESGKIYVTIDTGNVYRWSGSAYIRIADESPVWGIITGDLEDQTDLQNALNGKYPVPTGDTTQYIAGDGTLITFPVAGQAGTIVRLVTNVSGATITKGTVVYINGANGNKPTIAKAIATGDSTSAQTFGLLQADIPNNSSGYVVVMGDLIGVNTSAITEGTQLYLSSTTAGAYTTTKQLAPAHLVYIGVVTRSHASLGQIEVKIQNGYELDELHDVAISSKTNNQVLVYESSTDLWKNKSLGTILGGTSSQFVKGDGSLDSNTYALDNVVVKLTGDQSISGIKTFSTQIKSNILLINESGGFSGATGYTQLGGTADYFQIVNGGGSKQTKFIHTGVRNITMPAADGTMALTSQIPTVSGTTNYIPKFTGSNTIGDSVIFDDGTQIGIGTNVPQRKLSVRDVNNTYGATFSGSAGLNMVAIGTVSGATNGVPAIGAFTNSFGATTNLAINPTGGNVGIGTTNPAYKLQVNKSESGSAPGAVLRLENTGANYTSKLVLTDGTTNDANISYLGATQSLGFGLGTSLNQMVLTLSGNVGIGTTSPNYSSGGRTVVDINGTSQSMLALSVGGVGKGFLFYTGTDLLLSNETNGSIGFNANGDRRVTILPSGNVGIGTISPSEKLTVAGNVSLNGDYNIGIDITTSGNSKIGRLDRAYLQVNRSDFEGFLSFHTTSSGAGSLAERMRITSGGNVGIGTTSPSEKLEVQNGTAGAKIKVSNTGGGYAMLECSSNATSTATLSFTNSLALTGGNVGIGTTSPSGLLHLTGNSTSPITHIIENTNAGTSAGTKLSLRYNGVETAYLYNRFNGSDFNTDLGSADYFRILTAGSERMRITSGGVVCIGTTSAFDSGIVCSDGGTSFVPYTAKIGTTSSSTQMFFRNPNGVVGSISTSGSLTSFNVTSDYRLKQDFKPFNGLDLVSKIKVYDYAWKVDNSRMNGVIAHELQEVIPYAVTGEKDAEQMQSVDYSKLVPILVQAIQELKAEIEILKNK